MLDQSSYSTLRHPSIFRSGRRVDHMPSCHVLKRGDGQTLDGVIVLRSVGEYRVSNLSARIESLIPSLSVHSTIHDDEDCFVPPCASCLDDQCGCGSRRMRRYVHAVFQTIHYHYNTQRIGSDRIRFQ